jgi:hypothetical protein
MGIMGSAHLEGPAQPETMVKLHLRPLGVEGEINKEDRVSR